MNKNRFRVIYSQARGMFIAVAEIVKSRTKTAGQSHAVGEIEIEDITGAPSITYKKLNPVNFAVVSLLGAAIYTLPMATIAESHIVADKSAPNSQQATILNTSNGLTQVNIQTPSAGGVSRNTYTQFDVGQEGAILNNARNNTQTQLGGWVQGNPWLAKGEAKVILNEVNSSNPSQLKGYLEVAGKQAQVVIANPSGLVCDGCGVINADRFTLTTGQAVMHQGYLDSFRVREGQVTIEGKGLNGSLTPYTDIYARALNVNAGLYANELKTVLGQNDINIQDPSVPQIAKATSGVNTTSQPNFALDVGQLGGMYAGKIYLVGTENGLGVRNAGSINATTSQLSLNANGDLINTGNMIANKDQIIVEAQQVKNSGNISSTQHQIQIQAENIQNSGLIATNDEIKLKAQAKIDNNEGVINAGRIDFTAQNLSNNAGKIEQTGQQHLNIHAKTLDNTQGLVGQATKESSGTGGTSGGTTTPSVTDPEQQSSAQDSSKVEVAPTDLTPKTFEAGNIQIAQDMSNIDGAIVNNADISLNVRDSIKNNGGEIQLPELQFNGQNFENQQGKLTAKVVNITAQQVDNQKGLIDANQSFDLNAVQLNNTQGRVQSAKAFNLNSTEINNNQGQILAADRLSLNSKTTNNSQGVIGSVNADAELSIQTLDNRQGEISAQNVQLNGQSLNNQQGTIQAKKADLTINVDQIDNGTSQDSAGHLIAGQNLKLNVLQLQSTGQIYAGNSADLTVNQLQQYGQLAALNKINVQADTITSDKNAVWAAGLDSEGKLSNADATLTLDAQNVQIAGKILSGKQIQIKAAQSTDLSQSESQAQNINITTTELKTNNAKIIANQQLDLIATQNIDNEKGQYSAEQINLNTAQLNNDQGLIQHTGKNDFILDVANRIDNNAGQIISNADKTEIKTNTLNSKAGEILHAGDQQLKITAQNLQGQQGKIQSNSHLKLDLGITNLDQALTAAQNIDLKATELSHQQGQLIQSDANGQLNVNVAQTLNNTSGVISAAGDAQLNISKLNNQQGVIQTLADKDLKLVTQQLDNQSGKIIAGRDAVIATAQLNNDTGTVYAAGKLGLHATQDVSNQQGLIAAKQHLILDAKNLNNHKGQIQTESGDANLTIAETLNNQSGSIQSANALNIMAAQVENQAGQLLSGTDTQLEVTDLNNQSGTIYAKKQLDLNVSGTTDNSAGTLAAEQNLNLNTQHLLNHVGQIRSENADSNLSIVQDIQNNRGLISAAKNLNLKAQNVTSQKGKIQSGASADIQLNNLDNTEGVVYAGEQLQLSATAELNNTQGVVAAEQLTDLKAGSVINNAGQIRSQQDQLKLNVQKDISNQAGEISAGKSIDLNAQNISNQKGKVIAGQSLNATVKQVDNTDGTVYAKDQLHLNVADQLNNQSGTIAANQHVQIQANSILNTAGKIRSEQNKLTLQVQQDLDNQKGEIFAGTDADIQASKINNQTGTIYSKNQLGLNAKQLNNQQGQIYSEDQAQIDVQGDIQNNNGVLLAGKNLDIQSRLLDNTEGMIRSEKSDLYIAAQGQLLNQKGDIYAAQNASLNSVGLDNTAGQIAAQNQLSIDTQKQQLSNQNGKIIAKTVDLKTGKLDNQTGLIQAEQSVKIDTQQNALLNNNSGNNAGILSQGSLDLLNITQLENTRGYIAAIGSANIAAQNINNNSGQINSQADLNIHQQTSGGRIDNLAGQIQAQQNVSLNSDTINNSGVGSHIVAGEKLTATANQFINAQTKDSTVLGGLDAKNIEINALTLDNQAGVIRASDNAILNINNQLSNQLGSISSLNTLSIGTANKTLNLNNTDGELLAKNQLNLKANELINKGKIVSEGNVDIDLKQSYTHTQADQISANGTLKLSTEQDLINQSELTAGQKVELNAKNIQNQTGASISSNETHLIAQNTLHNQGLINGELTHIQANRVWNDGARIYGTHVAIQANTLDNKSNSSGTGAVIASRGDMDLGIQILNNQSGGVVKESARDNAWIFSAGDLNIGGSLDVDLKAQGQAHTVNNLSARIESLGDMTLIAKNINNINQNFETKLVQIGGVTDKIYIQPKDKTTKIPVENLYWKNWSRAGLYRYDTTPNVLPENIKLGETPIPNVESVNCVGTGDEQSCNVNYKKSDPVWAYFNITPPSTDAPEAPTLVQPVPPTGQSSCEVGVGYDAVACAAYQTAYTQYQKDQQTYDQAQAQYKKDLDAWSSSDETAYQQLDEAIQAYNLKFDNTEIKAWTQYEVKETKFESQVVTSAPAEIIAGGDLNIYADAFKNDKSYVLAGGKLNAELAQAVNNIDGKGQQILKQSGISTYTYSNWRGGFKRYHERKWNKSQTYNPADEIKEIDLPVNQWLGNVKNHTSNQNISAVSTGNHATITTDTVNTPEQLVDRQQQSQQVDINVNAGQSVTANGQERNTPNTPDQLDVNSGEKAQVNSQAQNLQSLDSAEKLQANAAQTTGVKGQGDLEIRSVSMDFMSLPSNALFSTNTESQSKYLVETDPAFINYKQWLSSDYMLDAMDIDPALKQKRLGDGYYEQRLVQDQIAQLTGFRFLQGYANDEAQYKALMNNGLTFAKNYNLRPGIALTAAQIAQLTTDIVWLEEKTIKLADGTTTKALVPQVYVKARASDLKGDGTLVSANQVRLNVQGDVLNSATIAGREALQISADSINQLGGRMQANRVELNTTKDLNNIGGTIKAIDSAKLNIGGDFNQHSTTQSTVNNLGASVFTREGFDRQAGLYVGSSLNLADYKTDPLSTTLVINVGGNTSLKGTEIINLNGSSLLKTQGNLNIEGVNTSVNNRGYTNKDNYNYDKKQQDIGSFIQSAGDTRFQAENISVKGSQISSEQGSTILSAQQKIDISEGRKLSDAETAYKTKDKSTFSTTTEKGRVRNMSDEAIASTIDGKNVILDANNINIRGSNIISDELTQIQAKENVSITGAENKYLDYSESSVKKSGLMSSGGIGFSVGSKKELTEQQNTQSTNTGSMVGSLNGNTNIIAGKTYQQTGSTVSSQKGDVNILAQQVNIEAAKEQSTRDYKYEMEQKGLTLAVNVPVVSAVQSVVDSSKQVGQSKNDRVNAMAAANAGFDAYKAGQALGKLQGALSDASKLNGNVEVSVSLTYGEQKNTQFSQTQSSTASQSQVYAGGKTNIVATGAGEKSNINIIGSDVVGMQGTHLAANHDVNIKAAEQKTIEASGNKSAGWNAGVSVSNQTGFGVTAGGNLGKGKGNGTDTSYVNSHVGSKDSSTTISSGNATNIIGGQVQGKGVQIDANELNIESLQDTATFKSKQQNISGQVSVGTNGANASGSFSKSNVNANYASVNEQSGVFAGDDGYQIKVKNNTDLKGAIITSTQTAENLKKNSLDTGTLTHSDIRNVSEYDAKGISLSAGFNAGKSDEKGGKTPDTVLSKPNKIDQHASTTTGVSKSVGFGLDSDKNSSVTKSGINTSNITIRDEQGQQALTGKTAEQIKSDILTSVTTDTARENSGALKNNFDKDKVQSEINLQMEVTKNFDANRQEAKAEINKKIDDAKKENQAIIDKQKQGLSLSDQEQTQLNAYNDKVVNYQKLGVLLDSVATGLSAPTSSGLGIATATLSPVASYEIGQYFKSKDAEGSTAHILAHTVLGAAVAAAGGNDALTAGLSAGGAEAAAPKLAKYLYGKDAKDLTADEKSTISAITGLVASGVGATTGDVSNTVQSGNVAQNAVEDNLFGVLTADKKIDKQKNNYYFQALQACKSAECEKNIIMQNTLAAMQNVQKIISISSTKYNEGDIITNPNDSTGLRYLVVNQNGSLKAKLLPADYQALYSVNELNSSRALVQGGALTSIVANTLKSGHDVFADRSLFTNQEMTALSRTFAGVEVVGNVLMIGGAVAPKSIDLKAAAIHDKNPLKVDAIQHETKRLLVSQGNVPTCGHNSCVMVLDTLKKPVNVENLINSIPPKTDGITFKQVSELLKQNNVENYAFSSRTITQLEQYTSKGTPVIVRIADDKTGFSHFVVVDGVTIRGGKKVVAIRDPHNASYYSPIESFKKAFTGETVIPRNYK
ncbi:two-partner secretion domain-containing protein [Acinetobacter bereziniae]|uniref:two-partner secretion domain-containing protein n=1 Tax=Acinetobacter bereziniae TaxID=106648 RepID=UPI0021E4A6E4|nr:hemagglutinin repeat-containing protein [Acinetobacter bereziniae]MCV2442582.1 hemagglutinin repeat-containing protein [Acinetobacter bereziniae]